LARIVYQKPKLTDIPEMQRLVAEEVERGVILPRRDDEVATNIRSYIVARTDNGIIGYLALHIHTATLAEIRSLIVGREWRGEGVGRALVQEALREGRELGVQSVLALTYSREFFERLGFHEIEKRAIPEQKIWQDCIRCKHFPVCDEVAMMRTL